MLDTDRGVIPSGKIGKFSRRLFKDVIQALPFVNPLESVSFDFLISQYVLMIVIKVGILGLEFRPQSFIISKKPRPFPAGAVEPETFGVVPNWHYSSATCAPN